MTTFYFLLVQEEDLAREEDLLLVQEEDHIFPYWCLLGLITAYWGLFGLLIGAYWCLFGLHTGAYCCLLLLISNEKTFAMPKELPMIGNIMSGLIGPRYSKIKLLFCMNGGEKKKMHVFGSGALPRAPFCF